MTGMTIVDLVAAVHLLVARARVERWEVEKWEAAALDVLEVKWVVERWEAVAVLVARALEERWEAPLAAAAVQAPVPQVPPALQLRCLRGRVLISTAVSSVRTLGRVLRLQVARPVLLRAPAVAAALVREARWEAAAALEARWVVERWEAAAVRFGTNRYNAQY